MPFNIWFKTVISLFVLTNYNLKTGAFTSSHKRITSSSPFVLRQIISRRNKSIIELSETISDDLLIDTDEPISLIENKNKLRQLRFLQKQQQKQRSSILTPSRQRFVTGKYPLFVSVKDCPTQKWLGMNRKIDSSYKGSSDSGFTLGSATSQLYVNGTLVDRSLASFDRYKWLELESNDAPVDSESMRCLSLEFVAEIQMRKPGYLSILPNQGQGDTTTQHEESGYDVKQQLGDWFSKLQKLQQKGDLEADLSHGNEILWVTDFSVTKKGGITSLDTLSGDMKQIGRKSDENPLRDALKRLLSPNTHEKIVTNSLSPNTLSFDWPNEVGPVPAQSFTQSKHKSRKIEQKEHSDYENAILVTDGFLVPGRENGALYVVRNPGSPELERKVCLTGSPKTTSSSSSPSSSGWFYHRAVWVDLTGDGRKSILTARAKRPSILNINDQTQIRTGSFDSTSLTEETGSEHSSGIGQLIWLECPKPSRFDEETRMPLDEEGLPFDPFDLKHIPWKERILDEGPDVMFSVADLDTEDGTIEVIASQFFGKCVSLHSIELGNETNNHLPRLVFRRILDENCGASFSSLLANLDDNRSGVDDHNRSIVIDSGSTCKTLKMGDKFSHLLVTSHECTFSEVSDEVEDENHNSNEKSKSDGKQDIITSDMYEKPIKPDGGSLFAYKVPTRWKTDTWDRTVIATGFRVRGQFGNMINPGAPGFCYTFYPRRDIAKGTNARPHIAVSGDCAEAAFIFNPSNENLAEDHIKIEGVDRRTKYSLMCEIECGATVGSLAVGYENFCGAEGQKEDYAKIYIPCFEKDKVLVFAFGNGQDD